MTTKILIALMQTINLVCTLYFYLILIRCILSWIPNININRQPFAFIYGSTDWYLDLFRRIIPPFGGIDFSPIAAVFVLYFVQIILIRIIYYIGALIA